MSAGTIAAIVRTLAVQHNGFRGQAISFGREMFGERATVLQQFHTRPTMTAKDVILPEETLAMIRRQVVGVAEHRQQLLTAGQHLKRGLLLYGPPGVGKDTASWSCAAVITSVTSVNGRRSFVRSRSA